MAHACFGVEGVSIGAPKRVCLAFVLALAGCATEVPLGVGVDATTAQQRARVVDGIGMTRERVMAELGAPWLSSAHRRVDVFKLTAKQRNALVVFTPWPVPVPSFSNRFRLYSLVAYAPDGRVEAADSAFVVSAALGISNVQEPGHKPAASAGAYLFVHPDVGSDHAVLSATLARFVADQATEPAASSHCTLVPVCPVLRGGAERAFCLSQVSIDGNAVGNGVVASIWSERADEQTKADTAASIEAYALPPSCPPGLGFCSHLLRQSVPLRLPPGRHVLRFEGRQLEGSVEGNLACAAGELWYAVLEGEVDVLYSIREQLTHGLALGHVQGHLTFTRTLPSSSPSPRIVLMFGDAWLDGRAAPDDH